MSRPSLYSAFVIGLAIAGAGCNVGPKYAKPAVPAPVAYKETAPAEFKEGAGWKIAQPGDDKIRANWWEMYNDPQLNALEEQVRISNQSIAASEASFRQARALVLSARSALFPTLTTSPGYTNSRFSQTSRTSALALSTSGGSSSSTTSTTSSGGIGSGSVVNEFTLPLDLSYEVDLWHRIRNTVAANAFSAQASSADVATALLSTQSELAQDYFEIRALDMERRILNETVASYQSTLELTKHLFNLGILADTDVAQAQTQLDSSIADATDLGVSRATYEHAIAVLIGKPPANFSLEVAPFNPNPPAVPVGLPSELLERRPDIAAAERRVASANEQIGVARAAYFPRLLINASGGFESSSIAQWLTWPSRFWSVGPQLAQTLFDAGARRAQNEQAQASYDQTVANYRQAVLTALQQVEDNLSTLRILAQEAVQRRVAVASSQHLVDLTMSRYRNGIDSYLNVLTAQTALLTNRETEVQTQLRQMTASANLIMALGGGWGVADLPQMKDLLAKPPKSSSTHAQPTVTPVSLAPANPPPLSQ